MKLLNREDFMALPAGTIYAKGTAIASFGSLEIKADSLGGDWVCLDPCYVDGRDPGECDERFEDMLLNGASYPMRSAFGRDGCFEQDAIFLVFEKDDLLQLRKYVEEAIAVA